MHVCNKYNIDIDRQCAGRSYNTVADFWRINSMMFCPIDLIAITTSDRFSESTRPLDRMTAPAPRSTCTLCAHRPPLLATKTEMAPRRRVQRRLKGAPDSRSDRSATARNVRDGRIAGLQRTPAKSWPGSGCPQGQPPSGRQTGLDSGCGRPHRGRLPRPALIGTRYGGLGRGAVVRYGRVPEPYQPRPRRPRPGAIRLRFRRPGPVTPVQDRMRAAPVALGHDRRCPTRTRTAGKGPRRRASVGLTTREGLSNRPAQQKRPGRSRALR